MGKEKGASQTEKPTPKRVKDARKDGQIHKSRELTSTALVLLWLLMGWMLAPVLFAQFQLLFEQLFTSLGQPFGVALSNLAVASIKTLLYLLFILFLPPILLGLLTDFMQVGAIFAPTKVKPNGQHLNPVEGIKRMFSGRNLVEVVKAVVKTLLLGGVLVFTVLWFLDDIVMLPLAGPELIGGVFWRGTVLMGFGVIFLFFFVAVLDALYQRHAFVKDLMMSRRDIKQESKENEGDPQIKNQRKQLHQEWAQQNTLQAVRQSSVVVTNPTHVAVALHYDEHDTELPVVMAKGEDYDAKVIREAAEEAGIPIMQNIPLARGLYEDVNVDQYITSEYFDAVAQLLKWAEAVRRERYG